MLNRRGPGDNCIDIEDIRSEKSLKMRNVQFISAWRRTESFTSVIQVCLTSYTLPLQTHLKAAQASQGSRTFVCVLRSASFPSVNYSRTPENSLGCRFAI